MAFSLDWRARRLVARIQRNHADRSAIEALAAHYSKRGDQASLANLMVGYAETLDDSSLAADAYVRAADASLMLDDRARAEALYERALQREPGHSGALDRALRVAETTSNVEAMRRVLSNAVEAAQARALPGKQIAALQFRLGQLYETRLRDAPRAAHCYRLAIENYPGFVGAIAAARQLYRRAGDWATVSRLYEAEIAANPERAEQRELLFRLAEHEQWKREDLNAAVAALRRACKLDPEDPTSLRKLAEVLVSRSERASGSARDKDAQRAAEILYQLARQVPRAEAPPLLERALEIAPEHTRARALLHELRGHAADGGDVNGSLHADTPQQYLDGRDTAQALNPLDSDGNALPRSPSADATEALDTLEIAALRVDAASAPAEQTQALDTQAIEALRVDAPSAAADQTQALDTQALKAVRVDLPDAEPSEARADQNQASAERSQAAELRTAEAARVEASDAAPIEQDRAPDRQLSQTAYGETSDAARAEQNTARGTDSRPAGRGEASDAAPADQNTARGLQPSEAGRNEAPAPAPAEHSRAPARSAQTRRSRPVRARSPARRKRPPDPQTSSAAGSEASDSAPAQQNQAPELQAVEPTRVELSEVARADQTQALDTQALRAVRVEEFEAGPAALDARAVQGVLGDASEGVSSVGTQPAAAAGAPEPANEPEEAEVVAASPAEREAIRSELETTIGELALIADAARAATRAELASTITELTELAIEEERASRAQIVPRLELDPIREEVEVDLGATTDSNLYVDVAGRVADGGVFIATYRTLPAATLVTLRITLPGELETCAHGRVTRQREHLEVFRDPIPGYCVAFETLSRETLDLLERFAAQRTPWLIEDE